MAVNAQELRIGNFIQTPEGLAKVVTIANMKIGGTRLENGNHKVMEYEDCEPIELTVDWLDRFGFIKEDETWWNNHVGVKTVEGGFYFSAMHDGITDISYVHQLQNLAYAINQTELTLE
ncbi:hypothetical protein [Mucilaginibacter sp. UR6-11]|uniref:hypothetical protein n=1 Tax=Mucilaginibacter sp. UR6-11 TaxID=1435644 RepID=UPI001E4FCD50|nr:hypothetical protein [Mucilaginibacter sp. UR6-11]MCC8423574.1 hypothetical protein [Mucilaginibacter sp. UR6-11]